MTMGYGGSGASPSWYTMDRSPVRIIAGPTCRDRQPSTPEGILESLISLTAWRGRTCAQKHGDWQAFKLVTSRFELCSNNSATGAILSTLTRTHHVQEQDSALNSSNYICLKLFYQAKYRMRFNRTVRHWFKNRNWNISKTQTKHWPETCPTASTTSINTWGC